MTRTGEPSIAELMAQLAANAAEIAALKAEKEALSQRVVKLEEELALAKVHRFAPRSEKQVDRLFNEAEEAVDEDDSGDGDDVVDLPDTGLPAVASAVGKKRGRRPLPEDLPRERVEYDLPDDQKACRAAIVKCIAWARPLPSSFISKSRQRSCRTSGSNMPAAIATAPGSTHPS
ncbi:UNVERIFIED_ORG: hypothetical protein GGD51_000666 [Rhizobium esperanzae]